MTTRSNGNLDQYMYVFFCIVSLINILLYICSVFCGFILALCLSATILETMQNSVVVSEDKSTIRKPSEISMDQEQNEVTPLISSESKPRENIERSKCKYKKIKSSSERLLKSYFSKSLIIHEPRTNEI